MPGARNVLVLIALALSLTGCGAQSNFPVPTALVSAVLLALQRKRFLQFNSDDPAPPGQGAGVDLSLVFKEDSHKGFFIYRRAISILTRNRNRSRPAA